METVAAHLVANLIALLFALLTGQQGHTALDIGEPMTQHPAVEIVEYIEEPTEPTFVETMPDVVEHPGVELPEWAPAEGPGWEDEGFVDDEQPATTAATSTTGQEG